MTFTVRTLDYIIIGLLVACLICLAIAIRQQAVLGRSLRRVRQMQQRFYWAEYPGEEDEE